MPTTSNARAARAAAHSKERNDRADKEADERKRLAEKRRREEFERTREEREAARVAAEAAAAAFMKARRAKEAEENGPMTLDRLHGIYGDIGRAKVVLSLMEERRKALAAAEEAAEEAAKKAEAAVDAGNDLAEQMKGLSIRKSGGGYTRRTKRKTRRTYKNRR